MKKHGTRDPGRSGRPPKEAGDIQRDARFTVNMPPKLVPQLDEEADKVGLPRAAFMRMAVIKELHRLEKENLKERAG
jgi:metal-responsive CopG/Arc/MetJ family transcriptional regulator